MTSRFLKDPDATLDYLVNFGRALPTGDTISTRTVTVAAGITKVSDAIVAGTDPNNVSVASGAVLVWLSGGTLNQEYPVTCHVTTTAGRIMDETFTVRIVPS
jgi:hypothetical protein